MTSLLRRLAPAFAVATAVSWSVGAALLGGAYARQESLGPPTADNPCPSCDALINVLQSLGFVAIVLAVVMFGLSLIGLVLITLPPVARLGVWLTLIGLLLLGAYGFGVLVVIPGLVVLAIGLQSSPLPMGPPVLMVTAFFAAVALASLLGERPVSMVVIVSFYTSVALIGLAWTWMGLAMRRLI